MTPADSGDSQTEKWERKRKDQRRSADETQAAAPACAFGEQSKCTGSGNDEDPGNRNDRVFIDRKFSHKLHEIKKNQRPGRTRAANLWLHPIQVGSWMPRSRSPELQSPRIGDACQFSSGIVGAPEQNGPRGRVLSPPRILGLKKEGAPSRFLSGRKFSASPRLAPSTRAGSERRPGLRRTG